MADLASITELVELAVGSNRLIQSFRQLYDGRSFDKTNRTNLDTLAAAAAITTIMLGTIVQVPERHYLHERRTISQYKSGVK